MLIKDTTLTEGLRSRLANAGSGRTLDVFPVGTDIYVGAELAGEEQIEVIAISAAHAAEPFGGPEIDIELPDWLTPQEPWLTGYETDPVMFVLERRNRLGDSTLYTISKSGYLRSTDSNYEGVPPEAWAWLTDKWRRSGGKRA